MNRQERALSNRLTLIRRRAQKKPDLSNRVHPLSAHRNKTKDGVQSVAFYVGLVERTSTPSIGRIKRQDYRLLKGMTRLDSLVYGHLLFRSNKESLTVTMGAGELCRYLGTDRRSAQRSIGNLIKLGMIEREGVSKVPSLTEGGRQSSNYYTILPQPWWPTKRTVKDDAEAKVEE